MSARFTWEWTRDRRLASLATALLALSWIAGYRFALDRQGMNLNAPVTIYFAYFVGAMAMLAVAAAVVPPRGKRVAQGLLYAAAGGLLPVGWLGLATIGLPLIFVGFLALVAAGLPRMPARFGFAAGALSVLALAIGLALTNRWIDL